MGLAGGMITISISLYALNLWLEVFAYHINITAGSYALTFAAIIFLLLTTVGFQTLKASKRNPARTLREE